jgi:hypothetical protein
MKHKVFGALALALSLPLAAHGENADTRETQAAEPEQPSEFIGRYNGNSFETAMGMIIREDGTFAWGLSVGGLDLRAAGNWRQSGEFILFTSDPVPVPPEFRWSGNESTPEGGELVKVVRASNGEPFTYASVRLTCANGADFYGSIDAEGWSPPAGECDAPVSLQLEQSNYNVTSPVYDMADTFAVEPGQTIRFEFHANDIGVADFTGMSGVLEDGILRVNGGEWPLELRKLPPREPAQP